MVFCALSLELRGSYLGSDMRIDLASLDGGKGDFDHAYEPGELAMDDDRQRLSQNPRISGRITAKSQRVEIEGRLTAEIEVDCDRCLKPVKLPVDARFDRAFVTTQEYEAQHAAELTEEELDLSTYHGETIDLDSLVKEELLLAVPTQVLCQENCKGICAVCGEDNNLVSCNCAASETDPRWTALEGLVNRK